MSDVIEDSARRWRPSQGWAPTLATAAAALERDPTDVTAWCEIATLLGDTHAAPLALIACLHAERVAPAGTDLGRLHAHRNLCLMDLGLVAPDGPVALRDLDRVVADVPTAVDAWLADALAPFDGDLARAAQYVLAHTLSYFAT